ncbi:Ankyrin repeat and KH domain-containing protein 1 (HIV-1 Vpr-binding ankyrin repeat protein) (Multiple ankyrin repeats single KH domain) (hMASK) [Durusdinium trenchii]|uniref:Ankyrin repeat and KH domain-containing protein 1 (HIV-1 Vpr-binding ankyrin repeat protein) (Multiple ankyrin repeats single KH domain) (HMASK) n=1 Tax=Durusdinium trenchii TaxID=1381693 RepID=A0ABP0QTY1_9DINO
MPCCAKRRAVRHTPLEQYAKSLEVQEAAIEADPLELFPMYVVPLDVLLDMTQVVPHENLKTEGKLLEYEESMGNAAFVSHQWVDRSHPDPQFKQLSVLQDALRNAMSRTMREISLDVVTATVMPSTKSLPTSELWSRELFLWYDYFSCPQLERTNRAAMPATTCSNTGESNLSKAIDSIPAYVGRCSFFFALCPVLEDPTGCRLLTPATWAERGWCRVERAVRELCPNESWIMIRSAIDLELVVIPAVSPVGCLGGRPPGEGDFSVAGDRVKLRPLLVEALKRKLLLLLEAQDLVNYRLLLNLQSVHFRGFPEARPFEPIPGFQAQPLPRSDRFHSFLDSSEGLQSGGAGGARPLLVARFLYQNGFRSVHETDSAGWSPLHYASLRGSPALIQGLLSLRADPNRLTKQDQPRVGLPPMTSPLTICVCFKHNQAARQLIAARAKIDGGLLKPLEFASVGDNPEGVRLLCEAGSSVHSRSIMGFTALEIACCRGAMAAMLEIARQAGENMDLSGALWCALALKAEGGTAGIVEWLLDRRADVNQSRDPWMHSSLYGALALSKALQHRFGTGATPLVMAMIESQYEGAATLIAAGARLDLPNARGCCAADFIREQAVPDFLAQAVEGATYKNVEEYRPWRKARAMLSSPSDGLML